MKKNKKIYPRLVTAFSILLLYGKMIGLRLGPPLPLFPSIIPSNIVLILESTKEENWCCIVSGGQGDTSQTMQLLRWNVWEIFIKQALRIVIEIESEHYVHSMKLLLLCKLTVMLYIGTKNIISRLCNVMSYWQC